jgi:putative addiction module component (TIGR02574 family)
LAANSIQWAERKVEILSHTSILFPIPMTIEEIVEETKQWPGDVVTELVDRIMLAKHGGIDPAVDAAWRAEAHRRRAELESGKVKGIPLEETLARARKIIGR